VDDFNGDTDADLVTANAGSDNVSILLGAADGSFEAPTNFTAGSVPRSVAVGDFNGDSDPDLAVANHDSDDVSILLNTTTAINAYPRPASATPVRVSLVPAYDQCTEPNRTHGPPLAFGSCAPPTPSSPNLKVGVGDTSSSIGFVRFRVIRGDPAPPDDSDVRIEFRLSNVMRTADLSEYTGELRASAQVRLTDRQGTVSQTAVDFPLEFDVPCVPTESTATKSLCALTTTLDAVTPGAAAEGTRAVFALDQVEVYDGGPDGDASTADNTVFARQGLFVP
jgi:hypothetical protein